MKPILVQTDLNILCPELLKHLPGDWQCKHVNFNGGEIVRSDDQLHLALRVNGQKLEVAYSRPADLDGNTPAIYEKLSEESLTTEPVINPFMRFSLTREIADISRDIARDLLPDAWKVHAKVMARLTEANKLIERMRALRAEFCNTIGCQRVPQSSYSFGHMVGSAICHLQINSPDSITINLQGVSEIKTRAILQILKNNGA